MSQSFGRAVFELIETFRFDEPSFEEIADGAFSVLAYALSHMPARERERRLQAFEDGHSLRTAVQRLLDCPTRPDQPIMKVH